MCVFRGSNTIKSNKYYSITCSWLLKPPLLLKLLLFCHLTRDPPESQRAKQISITQTPVCRTSQKCPLMNVFVYSWSVWPSYSPVHGLKTGSHKRNTWHHFAFTLILVLYFQIPSVLYVFIYFGLHFFFCCDILLCFNIIAHFFFCTFPLLPPLFWTIVQPLMR